jgi:integrase
MRKHHAQNERIKRQYFAYLEEAMGMSKSSVDQVAAAIAQFETSTAHRDFRAFHIEQARKFKRQLAEAINPATGKSLAKATVYSRLMALKAFSKWLAREPGYKRLTYSDADYFNPSNNDGRIAKAVRKRAVPTPEQVFHVLSAMPRETDIEKRDRALVAFALLSGARNDAMASMSLRNVDLAQRTVFQDARHVRTKNRKTFTSNFFPVGADIEAIVTDWILYLTREKLYGPDDPLFPTTQVAVEESGHFESVGLKREHWRGGDAIRRVFRRAFEAAGLPYSNPHLCRDTLTLMGEQRCTTPEELKAWSQNLGHDHVLTTLTSYGAVSSARQSEILSSMRGNEAGTSAEPDPETVRRVVTHLLKKAS